MVDWKQRAEQAEAELAVLREALANVYQAWNTLPNGNHPMSVVSEWLHDTMVSTMKAARAALTPDAKSDNG